MTTGIYGQRLRLIGEHDGKTVKLFWQFGRWSESHSGVVLKKRIIQAPGDTTSWVPVNSGKIYPGLYPEKDLNAVESDQKEQARLQRKVKSLIDSARMLEVKESEYLMKLKNDTSQIPALWIALMYDFDLAMVNGFAAVDRFPPNGKQVQYGVFFLNKDGNELGFPAAIWNCEAGRSTLDEIKANMQFVPNLKHTAVTLTWSVKSFKFREDYAAFNLYKKIGNGPSIKLNKFPVLGNSFSDTMTFMFLDNKSSMTEVASYSLEPIGILGFKGKWLGFEYISSQFAPLITPPELSEAHLKTGIKGISLQWSFSKEFEPWISGFRLERKFHVDSNYRQAGTLLPANVREVYDKEGIISNGYQFYRLTPVLKKDNYTLPLLSNEILVFYVNLEKPIPVKNIKGKFITENGRRYIELSWNPSMDPITAGYHIYASFPPKKKLLYQSDIGLVKSSSFKYEVSNYQSADYFFSITAVSQFNQESLITDTLKVNSPTYTVPNIKIWPFTVDSNQITLNWNYAYFSDLKGYRLYIDGKLLLDERVLTPELQRHVLKAMEYNKQFTFEIESVTMSGKTSRRSYPLFVKTPRKGKK